MRNSEDWQPEVFARRAFDIQASRSATEKGASAFPNRSVIAWATALVMTGSNDGSRSAIATATGFPCTKPVPAFVLRCRRLSCRLGPEKWSRV